MNTAANITANGDIVNDIESMHSKFGVNNRVAEIAIGENNREILLDYLKFRLDMCQEELTETFDAFNAKDAEEVVDGLIDLIVFAVGTLDVLNVNVKKAWINVMNANLAKNPGIKPERPNKYGFPDLIKPTGWVAPSHKGNHGILTQIFGGN